jgi:hypothetical protein
MSGSERRTIAAIAGIIICTALLIPLVAATAWMSYVTWVVSRILLERSDILQLGLQWFAVLALGYAILNLSSYLLWKSRGF